MKHEAKFLNMNSVKMKNNNYAMIGNKAIAQVVAVATEEKLFNIYVAWEWEGMATDGFFAVCKSNEPVRYISDLEINKAADYGTDITHTSEAIKLFPNLFF